MIHTTEAPMPPKLPPHVRMVKNKIGRPYLYLQRGRGTAQSERAIRLPDDPSSTEFWSEYARLMGHPVVPVNANSIDALIKAWQSSPEWQALAPATRDGWARACKRISAAWGPLEVAGIEPRHVIKLRDGYASSPSSANVLLTCLSNMLSWSTPRGWRLDNPCREVRKLRIGDGYAPWPWEVIETARAELPPHIWWAVALALYTGQRLGDVLAMRWDAISAGMISVRQQKTGKRLMIPIHKDLRAVIDDIPRSAVTILSSTEGRPWAKSGFQSAWTAYRPAAAEGLVFHGLRKSAVVTLLECGCTDAEVAAITGQGRDMVEHYAKQVNQAKLAASAILRWETGR